MAFCTSGFKAAKNILHKLTDPLENIIDKVLAVSGSIMGGAAWPFIQSLISGLPGGTAINAVLLKAVSVLTDSKEVLDAPNWDIATQLFIADIQKYDPLKQHALLIKWASIVSAGIHAAEILAGNIEGEEEHKESVYDSLTQLKAVIINGEQKKAA